MKTEPLQISSPERTRALDRQLYADHLAEQQAERRERIATATLAALITRGPHNSFEAAVSEAIEYGDALIAALDHDARLAAHDALAEQRIFPKDAP